MEFRRLIIAQKNSSNKYIFNNKVNLVTSTMLSDELLKANINLVETDYYIESLDNISIADVFQIKVRIASTGIIVVNFPKERVSDTDKENLLKEISALKDNVEPTYDTQKAKIERVIDIVNKYSPIYVCYTNTGELLYTKSMIEEMVKEKEIDFPILVLLTSLDFVDEPARTKKWGLNKKQPVNKPEKVRQPSNGKFDIVDLLEPFKSLDFMFFGIFSMFIGFGFIISLFEIQNGEGIAAFLLILSIAFIITLYYAVYKASQESKYFTYELKRIWVPVTYILVGVGLGIVIGYVITTFVIKVKEDIEINYGLIYGLGVALSIIISLASLATPKPISELIKKLKSNKNK